MYGAIAASTAPEAAHEQRGGVPQRAGAALQPEQVGHGARRRAEARVALDGGPELLAVALGLARAPCGCRRSREVSTPIRATSGGRPSSCGRR